MNAIELDFEQAKAKHLLFKSRLRSILYDIEVDEVPVLSHHECGVGKWIYGHALAAYGHLPEMIELERVHADIHTSARQLVALYRAGQVEEARQGLSEMEEVADHLIALLSRLEAQLQHTAPADVAADAYISLSLRDFQEMLRTNQELDVRIKQQVAETARATERFNLIARATQDVVWDWDLRTNLLWWSNAFQTNFGYRPDQVEPSIDSWTRRVHSDDRERIEHSIHAAIDAREPRWSDEYLFRRADGSYAEVLDRGYVLYDPHTQEPLRMVGSMTDVTHQRELTQALKHSTQELDRQQVLMRTISDNADVALFVLDDQQQCVFMNPAAEQLTGFTLGQVRGSNLHDFIHHTHPDGTPYPMADCPIDRALPERSRMKGEDVFIRPDGTFYPVGFTASPILSTEGQPVGTVLEVRDLTEQRKNQTALQESETLFRTITSASPVGLFLTDDAGRVVYANQTVLDWLGMSMAQYLVNAGAEAIVAEDLPGLTARYGQAFVARQPYTDEVRIHHADGTVHVCQLAAVPRKGADGAFAGYVGSFSDITERKLSEERLKQYYDDLDVKVTFRNLELERQVRALQARLDAAGEPTSPV